MAIMLGKDWRACASYNLSIDSGTLGIEKSVELIKQYIAIRTA